ncbi:hypothetical protein ID11_19700 (plasmid) [Pantoea vagans]|nr:hypothetical protein ID11_19700 [Pantoea vagans]
MQAKTENRAEWKIFSDAQHTAEKNGILIDYVQMTFGNDICLVTFAQRNHESASGKFFAMPDCTTDSVEFSQK